MAFLERLFTRKIYFLVESAFAFRVSTAAFAVESIAVLAESAIAVTLSLAADAVESTTLASVLAPLQAAKEPIAK